MHKDAPVKMFALILCGLVLPCSQVAYCPGGRPAQALAQQHRRKKRVQPRKMNKPTVQKTVEKSVGTRLPPDTWGGKHIRLDVSETGASLEFDCAHSSIAQPIMLNEKNSFETEGVYVREHAGPERPNERPDSHPVRYTGQVDGSKMTLTVMLTDLKQDIGTFTLTRGQSAALFKCM